MRPSAPVKAIAFFKPRDLGSTKLISSIQGQSSNLHIRGIFKKKDPPLILVSTRPEETREDVLNLEKYVQDIRTKRKWVDLRMYGGGIHYGISIDFSKIKVRRVQTEDEFIEHAKMGSSTPGVDEWVRNALSGGKLGFTPVITGSKAALKPAPKAGKTKTIKLLPTAQGDRGWVHKLPPTYQPEEPIPELGKPTIVLGGRVVIRSGVRAAQDPQLAPGAQVGRVVRPGETIPINPSYEDSQAEFRSIKFNPTVEGTSVYRTIKPKPTAEEATKSADATTWEPPARQQGAEPSSAEMTPDETKAHSTPVPVKFETDGTVATAQASVVAPIRDPTEVIKMEEPKSGELHKATTADNYNDRSVKAGVFNARPNVRSMMAAMAEEKAATRRADSLDNDEHAEYLCSLDKTVRVKRYRTAVPKPLIRKHEVGPIQEIGLIRRHYCHPIKWKAREWPFNARENE